MKITAFIVGLLLALSSNAFADRTVHVLAGVPRVGRDFRFSLLVTNISNVSQTIKIVGGLYREEDHKITAVVMCATCTANSMTGITRTLATNESATFYGVPIATTEPYREVSISDILTGNNVSTVVDFSIVASSTQDEGAVRASAYLVIQLAGVSMASTATYQGHKAHILINGDKPF